MQLFSNILVFSFTFIGDAILSTSVIGPLRSAYPQTQLSFLVSPAAYPLLEGDPQIDRVHVYDRQRQHRGVRGKLRLVQMLRRERFDLVVDLRDSLCSRFIGARRWGLQNRQHDVHAVTRYLSALRGLDTSGACPQITLTQAEQQAARRRLEGRQRDLLIAIHPGGNWKYKRWPAGHFARLADQLVDTLDADILLLGGPGEESLLRLVVEQMKHCPLLFNQVSLREVAALIAECDHYIGNDTGPMHLAASVGTLVTALFASTDHRRSGPYGMEHHVILGTHDLGCQPCHPGKHPGRCGQPSCAVLDSISVDQVFRDVCARCASSIRPTQRGRDGIRIAQAAPS